MKDELLKGLSKEQIAKVKACKNQDELLALAKAEGIQLTDEQLAAVSGGICTASSYHEKCPKCGSRDNDTRVFDYEWEHAKCNKCGYEWDYRFK